MKEITSKTKTLRDLLQVLNDAVPVQSAKTSALNT